MKSVQSNHFIKLTASLGILLASSQLNAACNRDDINFYLEKGFSTDQITKLCSESSAVVSTEMEQKATSNKKENPTEAVQDDVLYLMQAIRAQKIVVSDTSLTYTRNICFEYSEEDLFGFKPKTCPNVDFNISLNSLEVTKIGRMNYFYGESEVTVKSKIERDIVGGLKDLEEYDRSVILESFENGDETIIPIRDDFSLEKVKIILEGLSK